MPVTSEPQFPHSQSGGNTFCDMAQSWQKYHTLMLFIIIKGV